MLHQTENTNMPFIAIPKGDGAPRWFAWHTRYALWGLCALVAVGGVLEFAGHPRHSEFAHYNVARSQPVNGSASGRQPLGPTLTTGRGAARLASVSSAARAPLPATTSGTARKPVAKSPEPAVKSPEPAAKSPPVHGAAGGVSVQKPTTRIEPTAATQAAVAAGTVHTPPPATRGISAPAVAAAAPAPHGPSVVLDSALVAYDGAFYDEASRLISVALAAHGPDSLSTARRNTGLMYLGAAQWFRKSRDSATAVFRALLATSPRQKADTLVFPRPITDFFDGIRKSVYGVARVQESDHGVVVTVLAINPHHVTVDVCAEDGKRVTTLYDGPSADSLSLGWDKLGANGTVMPAGRYDVVVTARALDGHVLNIARFGVTTR